MKEALLYLLVITNIINMVHLGFYVIGANLYDMKVFRLRKRHEGTDETVSKYYRKPLVTIVVPAHNEEVGITRTLDSIRANTYKNIEIIVVDDGSTDKTPDIIRKYIRRAPGLKVASYMARYHRSSQLQRRYIRGDIDKIRMTLVSQSNTGKGSAVNNGIKNYARGKLVMCLDGDSILGTHAIENAVKYFDDPSVIGVAANVRVIDNGTLLARLQRFEHMIGYRSKKFYTLTNSEFVVGGVASTYRRTVLKEVGYYDTDTVTEDIGLSMKMVALKGNRKYRIVYGANVTAMTGAVQSFRALMRQRYRWKMGILQNLIKYRYLLGNDDAKKYSYSLTFYRIPMAFLSELLLMIEPIVLGFVVYLSIAYRTPWILVGAYITITLYVLWTVWPDEHLSNFDKFKLSFQSLQLYMLFYAMDVVQVSAIIRCLFNYKQIINGAPTQTWISPARVRQAAEV